MSLNETQEDLEDAIKESLSTIAGGYPIDELGEEFQNISLLFQALAISRLLNELDVGGAYRALRNSVFSRRYFLRKTIEKKSKDVIYTASSRSEALFDAIVCSDYHLAEEIKKLSPNAWAPKGEYEDDFHYFVFVHELVTPNSSLLIDYLKNYEDVVDEADCRFRLCKAILNIKTLDNFWVAFDGLLELRKAEIEVVTFGELWVEPRRKIFIEGLAWLKMAKERKFLKGDNEFSLCPSTLLATKPKQKADDLFYDLDKIINP